MPSLEFAMPPRRPRDKGPKPSRPGNRPDKHARSRIGSRERPSSPKSPIAAKGGQCIINGVTYRYDILPYSQIDIDGKSPERVIAEMSPEIRRNFGIVALVPDVAVKVLEGVRIEIVETLSTEDPDNAENSSTVAPQKTAVPKEKLSPSISPERTLEELRKELLTLLLCARERASKVDVVKRRVRGQKGERMEVERRGVLPRGDRARLRLLKREYRERLLSEKGVLLPPAMGSEVWFEMLGGKLAA